MAPRKPRSPEEEQIAIEHQKKKNELELTEKEIDVEKKAIDLEKKRKEAGLSEEEEDPELARKFGGGVLRDRFVTIWKKPPGESWGYMKKGLPVDEVDTIEDFINAEGDPTHEHKANIYDDEGKKVGKTRFYPARETVEGGSPSSSALDRELKDLETKLENKKKKERADKIRAKLSGDLDDSDEWVEVPGMPGVRMKKGGAHPFMGMGMFPWMQQPKDDGILKALVPVICAWISRPEPKSPIESMLPIILNNSKSFEPKDFIGMFSPIIASMNQASMDSNRVMMESMAQIDTTFRKKVLDIILSDKDRSPEEVEKWQRWLNFGETAIRKGAGIVRDALKGAGEEKKGIEKKPVERLEGQKEKKEEKTPEGEAKPEEQKKDPKADAETLKKIRIEKFLLCIEEEMLAESDPVLIAEETLEQQYRSLPLTLRKKVADMFEEDPASQEKILDLFSYLKTVSPEVTERIASHIAENPERQEWIKDFLYACEFDDETEEQPEEEPAKGKE